jgi:NAD(P)H-nitrite reductase large subunit
MVLHHYDVLLMATGSRAFMLKDMCQSFKASSPCEAGMMQMISKAMCSHQKAKWLLLVEVYWVLNWQHL